MKEVLYNDLVEDPSKLLRLVRSGEKILIKEKEKDRNLAVILPYDSYRQHAKIQDLTKRPLGTLKGKASFKIKKDFKLSDEGFLAS
ncbi:MAG: hypothetical protein D6732_00605 [Methanobacteriota archaeon]|nr:MAG: hypothetical protein D6732_00605 [Euryarchaeota archaeon]